MDTLRALPGYFEIRVNSKSDVSLKPFVLVLTNDDEKNTGHAYLAFRPVKKPTVSRSNLK